MEIRKKEALISRKDGKSKENMSVPYGDIEGDFVMDWVDPNAKKKKEEKQGKGKKAKVELGKKAM